MTPENKIKKTILLAAASDFEPALGRVYSLTLDEDRDVEATWDELDDMGYLQDARNEFREGEEETDMPCDWSRHYETKSVAAKMFDGSWVGWTYWYGGGKHGNPSEIEWMDESYDLNCKEEEKLVVVRTFEKLLDNQQEIV